MHIDMNLFAVSPANWKKFGQHMRGDHVVIHVTSDAWRYVAVRERDDLLWRPFTLKEITQAEATALVKHEINRQVYIDLDAWSLFIDRAEINEWLKVRSR